MLATLGGELACTSEWTYLFALYTFEASFLSYYFLLAALDTPSPPASRAASAGDNASPGGQCFAVHPRGPQAGIAPPQEDPGIGFALYPGGSLSGSTPPPSASTAVPGVSRLLPSVGGTCSGVSRMPCRTARIHEVKSRLPRRADDSLIPFVSSQSKRGRVSCGPARAPIMGFPGRPVTRAASASPVVPDSPCRGRSCEVCSFSGMTVTSWLGILITFYVMVLPPRFALELSVVQSAWPAVPTQASLSGT